MDFAAGSSATAPSADEDEEEGDVDEARARAGCGGETGRGGSVADGADVTTAAATDQNASELMDVDVVAGVVDSGLAVAVAAIGFETAMLVADSDEDMAWVTDGSVLSINKAATRGAKCGASDSTLKDRRCGTTIGRVW